MQSKRFGGAVTGSKSMRKLWTSAAFRIAFTYSSVFALTVILLGVEIYFAADASFRRQQDKQIAQETESLVRDFKDGGVKELQESIAARETASPANSFGYVLFDAKGARLAGSLQTPMAPAGWNNITFEDAREGPDAARALTTILPSGYVLLVAADSEPIEQIDHTILSLFAVAFVIVISIGIIGAFALGGYLRGRLSLISDTAQAIISGDLERRAPISARGDEFDAVALALNAMLDRIAQLLENLRQVSSDVAHDLRTPLARLRNQLEEVLAVAKDDKRVLAGLERSIAQSDEILGLFAAILRIAEIEAGALTRNFTDVELSLLVTELCESYAPAVADAGRELEWRIDDGVLVWGDRELIAQAIINLLDNAQHHTPKGARISVTLEVKDGRAILSIGDNGPGVPAEDRAKIVRRFARLESNRTTPGHGLGLNLVSAIAAAHSATMSIEDNAPGLRVVLSFERLAS